MKLNLFQLNKKGPYQDDIVYGLLQKLFNCRLEVEWL